MAINAEVLLAGCQEKVKELEAEVKESREALEAIEGWSDWSLWKGQNNRDRRAMLADIHAKAEAVLTKEKETTR